MCVMLLHININCTYTYISMLCWMHIYVLGTAVCIHLGACILLLILFFFLVVGSFSWAHCMLSKECSIFINVEKFLYILLLDVIFISSFFGINLRRKKNKIIVFDFLYGFLLHGTAVDYCTNCNSFYFSSVLFFFSSSFAMNCICDRFMLMFSMLLYCNGKKYINVIITFILCSL